MPSPLHALLIDDNACDRLLVVHELCQEFPLARVTQVAEARGFAKALESGPYDLIVTDYQLGWTDGLAILQTVKARWPDCPVIMFTGTGTEEVAVEAMKNGLDDYIVKSPKHFVRLRGAAGNALVRARDRRSLRESEGRYRHLVETAADIIFAVSDAGMIRDLNPAFTRLTGRSTTDWLGRSFLELVCDEDLQVARDALRRTLQGDTFPLFEVRLLRQAGDPISTEVTVSAELNDGMVVGALGIARDVTERKSAEMALRSSEAAQRRAAETQTAILNALPAHVALLDPRGLIVEVNESWRRFASVNALRSEDFYIGRNYLHVCDSALGECSDEARLVAQGLREVLAGTRPNFVIEYPCHSPDEERWFRMMATPLHEDRPEGAVVMHINITERRLIEEALRRSHFEQQQLAERLTAAQSVGKVGSWETDLSTMDITWSEQTHRIFETDPARFRPTYRAFLALVHPDDRDAIDRALQDSIREGHEPSIEHRVLLPDGRIKIVEERWRALLDGQGRPVRAVGTCQDITERKRAEGALAELALRMEAMSRQLLRAQEDERRRIARELHDEIGQALTAVKINLQISVGGADNPRIGESLEIVDRTLRQVRGMALDLRPTMLDDFGLIAALNWYIGRLIQRTGLQGRIVADPEDIRAHPEIETACFRIVQETLTNVVKHARATDFSVELIQHSVGLQLVVRDDGIGFDLEAALEATSSGASLGLAGMRERVELIGGRIAFVSEPGEGTEIQVEFPHTPFVPGSATEPEGPGESRGRRSAS